MVNLAHKNPNIPSNLYWAEIWWILLEEWSQCTWISFTSPTELKSSSPFKSRNVGEFKKKVEISKNVGKEEKIVVWREVKHKWSAKYWLIHVYSYVNLVYVGISAGFCVPLVITASPWKIWRFQIQKYSEAYAECGRYKKHTKFVGMLNQEVLEAGEAGAHVLTK